jgi:putative colanic acid biosynthesis acetyltransferase WcaF
MQQLENFRIPDGFRGRSAPMVQLWWLIDAVAFRPSPQICYAWRRFLLRLFGAAIGKGVRIRASVTVTYPWKLEVGDFSWIGDNATIYSLGRISIGKNTVISQDAYLCAGSHRTDSPTFEIYSSPINLGDSVWIAAGAFIGPGVIVGDGAIVGARSSVFRDVPPMSICLGTPATVKRMRTMSKL